MFVADDPEVVCPAIVPMMATPIIDMIGRELLTKERVCNEFLGVCSIPKFETITVEEYAARVLSDKPEQILNDDFVSNLYAQIYSDPNPRRKIRAVHMSDPHLDVDYKVGTLAYCDSYLCCREEFGYPTDPELQAGQFGGAFCDLPVDTFKDMMKHIAETVKPDLFFWTGDNSSHNVWSNSSQESVDYTNLVTQLIKESLQGLDIPVYPSLGNHDVWPVDV